MAATARPSWTGVVRFGKLDIPVQLIPACVDTDVEFKTLHAVDHGTLTSERRCKSCARVVDGSDTVRGVDIGAGQYAFVTDDELSMIAPASRNVIALDSYVAHGVIPLAHVEKPYFVQPDPSAGDDAGFHILVRALETAGVAAIGKVSFRSRERLVYLYTGGIAGEDQLLLNTMRFADELRTAPVIPEASVSKVLLDYAMAIIDSRRPRGFDPGRYVDEYLSRIRSLIESKRGKGARKPASEASMARALRGGLAAG